MPAQVCTLATDGLAAVGRAAGPATMSPASTRAMQPMCPWPQIVSSSVTTELAALPTPHSRGTTITSAAAPGSLARSAALPRVVLMAVTALVRPR